MQPLINAHHSADTHIRPLSTTHRGDCVRLVHIDAGHRLSHRLAELGLTPGVVMEVVNKNGGPMLIAVRGARLALGQGVTDKILVIPVEEEDA
jgi:Fe2+ transport system protein FeoA